MTNQVPCFGGGIFTMTGTAQFDNNPCFDFYLVDSVRPDFDMYKAQDGLVEWLKARDIKAEFRQLMRYHLELIPQGTTAICFGNVYFQRGKGIEIDQEEPIFQNHAFVMIWTTPNIMTIQAFSRQFKITRIHG